jgi:hypothetical protein
MAAKPFANFLAPASSLLVIRAGNGHCGAPSCVNNSPTALATLQAWAQAETAAAPVAVRATPVTERHTLELIAADIQAQPSGARPYLRYFTLEAWGNLGVEPPLVPADAERAALVKMINMLSTGPQIIQPVAVDVDKLIYRVDARTVRWTSAAWTNIKATDPYFVANAFPYGLQAAAEQTVRSDWFIANIANSAIDSYFKFLGIDSGDPAIDRLNGVHRFSDMATGAPATFRAGLTISRPEDFNRIISWHRTTAFGSGAAGAGHLFKSYNFDSDVGTQNIFSHPYRPITNNPDTPGAFDFDYADSDNLITLPNGLFGYYTTIGGDNGNVMTVANAGAGFPGPTFCLQCHDTNTNMFPVIDRVHDAVAADPRRDFPPDLKTLLLGMYDSNQLNARMTEAGALYAQAYAKLALSVPERAGRATELINVVSQTYLLVVNVDVASAELGVPPLVLVNAIKTSRTLSLELGGLIALDAAGQPNGMIRRDTWEANVMQVRAKVFSTFVPPPPPLDAGVPPFDAGTFTPDAGHSTDAGTPTPDAGTPIPDAGHPVDAGSVVDAGVHVIYAQDIQPIWNNRCIGCHGAGGAATAAAGLNLVSGSSYAALVNVPASCNPAVKLVAPGDSAASMLTLKLSDSPLKCGLVMPFAPGLASMAPDEYAKVDAWIRQGALDH